MIHSGTNHRILETMLESAGITDLFKDYICADMLNVAPDKLGKWGYKTELLRSLQEKYPTNGRQDFVVGDTKGDCFGAYDCQMPFVLVWRGYPKNPYELHAEDENGNPFTIAPDMIIDMRQDEVVDVLGGKVECFETELNVLIENESEQMSDLVDWCTSRCMPIAREDQKFFQQIVK